MADHLHDSSQPHPATAKPGAGKKPPPSASVADFLNLTSSEKIKFPDIDDLASALRFSPSDGHIWLGDQRMVLMHTGALGIMRRELIDTLGQDRARALLTRQGYEAGAMDAEFANRVRANGKMFDAFSVGPQLHALEGVVYVEPLVFDVDVEKGRFYAEYDWHHSSESEAHLAHFGVSATPVCWSQIGYASGYATVFLGRPIIYRELQCRAMGFERCRIVGKPAEEWDNPEQDLKYFRAENYVASGHAPDIAPTPAARGTTPARAPGPRPRRKGERRLVGASSGFNIAYHKLQRVAKTDATVLFLGESGVGKEMFACTLHKLSHRSGDPFITVNCAAIPENLVEAELFGVEKGAFTGAVMSRRGRFERADGGTLFLDEVGTLTLSAQAKLLRVLQEGQIERVGDTRIREVDVRVVAATNIDLEEAVGQGQFREDLYYRLNVFPIRIPPLRERYADIPMLIDHFLRQFSTRHKKRISGFTERAIGALMSYRWPGNIRELENMIERGVILAEDGEPIDLCHLFTSGEKIDKSVFSLDGSGRPIRSQYGEGGDADLAGDPAQADLYDSLLERPISLADVESRLIERALAKTGGNRSAAARLLGISRAQINYRLSKSKPSGRAGERQE